ncbi:amidase family protein [Tabrizicola sp.]|uniref:amidase family protein n=1 Tax=Tabrizicola sp. TaxID=2005166 RepID=UPI001A63AFA7|nr:amidase family protein [Tabrizicola sp.]MBL9072977.1 amidase family protein [Tabrizicola sp.]
MDPATFTASALAALIRSRQLSAEEAIRATLARIERLNPGLNAIVQRRDEDALSEARAVDARIAKGEDPGPLAGVPVTVKVNIDQAGFATTNGLRIQADLIAQEDSPPVANLRRAGAVIVGRTNTPAFSLRWFTRNALHGATKNPAFPALTPGGSSGGAASAVAAGLGPIAHGTDIAGSIRYPAYACGIHGLRPGLGRVPAFNATAGDRLIGGQLMAVSGPLARSAADLRLGLQALSQPDPRDPWWTAATATPYPRRAALALTPDSLNTDPAIRDALTAAAKTLESQGWEIGTPALPPFREAMELQLTLWLSEFGLGGAEAIAREADPDASFVHRELMKLAPPPTLESFMKALQSRARLARLWRGFFADWPVLLTPVSARLPFPDHYDTSSPDAFAKVIEAQMPQIAPPFMGLPGLTVTTGRTLSHPIGIQALADRGCEHILLDLADLLAPEIPAVTP